MANHIIVSWDGNEGQVRTNPSFDRLYDVARMDCIKDAIWKLEQMYAQESAKFLKQPKGSDTNE